MIKKKLNKKIKKVRTKTNKALKAGRKRAYKRTSEGIGFGGIR